MSPKNKERLDVLLVERGLAESRSKAARMLMSGEVEVEGLERIKPGSLVSRDARIHIKEDPCPFVSRGGIKLSGALDEWKINIEGATVLDVGASTGGFTDCMLQRGAKRVYAVDVGKGQLHWKLRNDERVIVHEGVNARHLDPRIIRHDIDYAVIDVSFISLEKILPAVVEVLKGRGEIIALVKPQFELGPKHVGKGGVVRDEAKQKKAVDKIISFAQTLDLVSLATSPSAVKGPKGNQEYFLRLAFAP